MLSLKSIRYVPLNYIKFITALNRKRFTSLISFSCTYASLRSLNRALLITRTYQSTPETLKVEFNDALSANLHYAWLRDSCRCSKCIHPESQQKLFDTTSLKLDIRPRFCHVTEKGHLKIVWDEGNADHVSMYDPHWLHKYALGFEKDLYEIVHDVLPPAECWTGKMLEQNLPQMEYEDIMESLPALYRSLKNIHKYGILFVRNVPCVPGEVINVMNRIANIKQTRWGSSFHITTDDAFRGPACITEVERVLGIHTDMDYLEKSPGLQATHCLESNYDSSFPSDGSKRPDHSYFVDGFYVAEWLKKNHMVYFNTLAAVPVKFRLFTQNMEYFSYQPILRLSRSRNVTEVHYNNRLMAPLEGPSRSVLDFFAAFKAFGEHLREPENLYSFTFKPGDLVILNNRRVLHGRYTFHFSKLQRHLEGCFADLDEAQAQYRSFLMKKRTNADK